MNYSHIYGILLTGALCCTGATASAQNDNDGNNKGWLSASFETNTIIYQEDKKSDATYPEDHFGSNNYLKLDYTKGRFTTGMQIESYLPVLQGYPTDLTGTQISNIYAQWADRDFTITAGSLYDQFGSGLLFRTWEDRMLGLNNALMGARATYSYKDIFNVKVLWGTPHLGMAYDTGTQVRGADFSLGLAPLFGWNNSNLNIEGSMLNRFMALGSSYPEDVNRNRTGYSGRINFETGGFTAKAEYVDNGTSYFMDFVDGQSTYVGKKGNAQLIELGYNNRGLGIFVTGRRLEWMQSQILMSSSSTANMINYIPAMSMQYTYALTNLHPYTPQIGEVAAKLSGEIGGQVDLFYSFRKGSALGGKRGMKIHANFATYYSMEAGGSAFNTKNLNFRDVNIDLEKWLSRKFKLAALWSMQTYNPSYGANSATTLSNIFVADMLYKFNSQHSLRWELQYLTTNSKENPEGDWMAALVEYNMAPKWSIYVSDMYNNGNANKDKRLHYYNVGVTFTQSRTRLQLSYGRNKAGYVCSGGVCRLMPAYTGVNFAMTISF